MTALLVVKLIPQPTTLNFVTSPENEHSGRTIVTPVDDGIYTGRHIITGLKTKAVIRKSNHPLTATITILSISSTAESEDFKVAEKIVDIFRNPCLNKDFNEVEYQRMWRVLEAAYGMSSARKLKFSHPRTQAFLIFFKEKEDFFSMKSRIFDTLGYHMCRELGLPNIPMSIPWTFIPDLEDFKKTNDDFRASERNEKKYLETAEQNEKKHRQTIDYGISVLLASTITTLYTCVGKNLTFESFLWFTFGAILSLGLWKHRDVLTWITSIREEMGIKKNLAFNKWYWVFKKEISNPDNGISSEKKNKLLKKLLRLILDFDDDFLNEKNRKKLSDVDVALKKIEIMRGSEADKNRNDQSFRGECTEILNNIGPKLRKHGLIGNGETFEDCPLESDEPGVCLKILEIIKERYEEHLKIEKGEIKEVLVIKEKNCIFTDENARIERHILPIQSLEKNNLFETFPKEGNQHLKSQPERRTYLIKKIQKTKGGIKVLLSKPSGSSDQTFEIANEFIDLLDNKTFWQTPWPTKLKELPGWIALLIILIEKLGSLIIFFIEGTK